MSDQAPDQGIPEDLAYPRALARLADLVYTMESTLTRLCEGVEALNKLPQEWRAYQVAATERVTAATGAIERNARAIDDLTRTTAEHAEYNGSLASWLRDVAHHLNQMRTQVADLQQAIDPLPPPPELHMLEVGATSTRVRRQRTG